MKKEISKGSRGMGKGERERTVRPKSQTLKKKETNTPVQTSVDICPLAYPRLACSPHSPALLGVEALLPPRTLWSCSSACVGVPWSSTVARASSAAHRATMAPTGTTPLPLQPVLRLNDNASAKRQWLRPAKGESARENQTSGARNETEMVSQ